MPELISAENLCGQSLLQLVARGSAIVAELLRLSQNIPDLFSADAARDPEQRRYLQLLFDFAYLKEPEEYEKRVNASTDLLDLDHEFLMNHSDILERFYQLFLSIYKYQRDFNKFVKDVQKGVYIRHSMDDVLLDTDGKQLMCEVLYLYGVMLLLLEQKIPGQIRERMVVAFYRSSGENNLEDVEQVCKLCRSTGFVPGQRKPKNYPENFFNRFTLPQQVVRLIIGRLQSDDVYLMSTTFPSPEHRSTRLANQAAMLYVLLYFAPDVLHKEKATMRELVDKHFSDNWIVAIYMGTVVDLTEEWVNYPAARSALENIVSVNQVEQLQRQNEELIRSCQEELRRFLTEGVVLKEFVVDNVDALLNCVRNCNVALRWILLHRRTADRRFREIIVDRGLSGEAVIKFLLKVSQLEYILKEIVQNLLNTRSETWETGKATCADRIMELADYYTGEKALTRVKRDENLMRYFAALAEQIRGLSLEEGHTTATGRKIQKIILALEDVEQFEQLDTDVQVKAFLHETRNILLQMIRTVNIKQEVLSIIENSSDLSYAWQSLHDYVDVFHRMIRQDPSSVVLLRAAFLKLASILDVPMIRITMCDSPDQESVAEYYSSELVDYVRDVMEVIPRSVFEYLLQIVDIQSKSMRPLPVRFEAKDLKEYAQLDHRYNMASLTHQVSIFTEGILVMERTLLGVIQVEPRKILEDGLRKELVRQVSHAMHNILSFSAFTADEIKTAMMKLAQCLDGFKRSIEYVQDYIDLPGLKIWQEEIARIINYNVEQECNRYVKRKIFDNQSRFQSRAIPIPRFPIMESDSTGAINFMGRIMSALLYLTDATKTVHAPECSGWYRATGEEVCGIRTFALLNNSIGVIGLRGLDTLFSFRIVHEMNQFLKFYQSDVQPQRTVLEIIREALFPEEKFPHQANKLYTNAMKKVEKFMLPLLKTIRKIGQAQLIRRQIANVLEFSCRLDANLLFQSLSTFDEALLRDVMDHYRAPETHPYPSDNNPLLEEFVKLADACGLSDPMSKVYITSPPLEGLPVLLMLFVLSYMPKLEYDKDFGALVRKKPAFPLDGVPLVVGFATLLRQFHPMVTNQVLAYLGQFVRGTMYTMLTSDNKPTTMPGEVLNTLIFMEQLCNYAHIPRTVVHAFVPPYIFDTIRFNN